MRFLADVNVPMSLIDWLRRVGHDVVYSADIMPVDAKDPVVAEAAMRDERILLSWDRDFGQQRFLKDRFRDLRRIGFSCPEPDGLARLREVFDLIEFAFARDPSACEVRVAMTKVQVRDKHI